MIKIIGINLLVFFALVGATEFLLPLTDEAYYQFLTKFSSPVPAGGSTPLARDDRRAELPNYRNIEWAGKHFDEYHQTSSSYRSYVGWQHDPFNGETINLVGPYNERITTHAESDNESSPSVYFFGGSTTWGVGANDASTIPSLFSLQTRYLARNLSGLGWRPRQGINRLIDVYEAGDRPDYVIFYNGVNHIDHCRTEQTPVQHSREQQIQERMRGADPSYGISTIMSTHRNWANKLQRMLSRQVGEKTPPYDCHTNAEKAEAVASSLIEEWKIAKALAEAHGAKFVAILQPVAYLSKTRLDHLQLEEDLGLQYKTVYPIVQKLMADLPWAYDATSVLDAEEYFYIDFCHLSPRGNKIIANYLADITGPM